MWRSFHVHYYDHDKNGLLLDAVRPFLHRIAPEVSGAHYLLHWLRGPHVRINVNAEPEGFATTVLPALDEVIRPYLAEHPSTAVIDTVALESQHTSCPARRRTGPDQSVVRGQFPPRGRP